MHTLHTDTAKKGGSILMVKKGEASPQPPPLPPKPKGTTQASFPTRSVSPYVNYPADIEDDPASTSPTQIPPPLPPKQKADNRTSPPSLPPPLPPKPKADNRRTSPRSYSSLPPPLPSKPKEKVTPVIH